MNVGTYRRAVVAVAIALAATAGHAGATPSTGTAAGKAVVVLGDSFAAGAMRPDGATSECRTSPTAWPTRMRIQLGLPETEMDDESCSGANIDSGPGYTLSHETLRASKAGAFGPHTRMVAIQIGLNDSWPSPNLMTLWPSLQTCVFNLIDGCGLEAAAQGRFPDYRAVSGTGFAQRLRPIIDYVRYYAPNARIELVGYPELMAPHQDTICVPLLGVGAFVQPRGAAMAEYLRRIQAAQQQAAALLGLDFLDMQALTAGHGGCSSQPWVNGVADPRTDVQGLPLHPSSVSYTAVAAALVHRMP